MKVQGFFDKATNTVTYLVACPETGKAAIIDPVLDFDPADAALKTTSIDTILGVAEGEELDILYVLDTHVHADHLSAGDYVRRKTGARYGIGAGITDVKQTFKAVFNVADIGPDTELFDDLYKEGDVITIGKMDVTVLHTPGHTPACLTYLIGDAAFVGDTLFMPDFGTARTDFPGGDARTLYQSIAKILSLAPETRIFVGHDYLSERRKLHVWETTVADQKAFNIHVGHGKTEDEFVAMREARDKELAAPRLILPSLQVNIRAGQLPPQEENGQVYLKLPVKGAERLQT